MTHAGTRTGHFDTQTYTVNHFSTVIYINNNILLSPLQ